MLLFYYYYYYYYYYFYIYEYKFTIENEKKTKKDIHQASKQLRIPGTNIKNIKFNNI